MLCSISSLKKFKVKAHHFMTKFKAFVLIVCMLALVYLVELNLGSYHALLMSLFLKRSKTGDRTVLFSSNRLCVILKVNFIFIPAQSLASYFLA